MSLKVYEIDGRKFQTFQEFAKEFGDTVIEGYAVSNLNAFNDVLRGGFGTPDEGFVLIWKHSDVSKLALGEDRFWRLVNIIQRHGAGGIESEDNVVLRLE